MTAPALPGPSFETVAVLVPASVALWLDEVTRSTWPRFAEDAATADELAQLDKAMTATGLSKVNYVAGCLIVQAYAEATGLNPYTP